MYGDFRGWRDITPKMRQRVRRVLKDWQQHARPFEDTTYWARRFLPFADVFAHTLPARPIQLWRAERTDIDNRYAERFTSWSRDPRNVEGFGWGQRRMVTAVFEPADILVDFVNLDLDTEGFQEVIVRPGRHQIIPWRLGWDRVGEFNVYEQPERARAAGYQLGGDASGMTRVAYHGSAIDLRHVDIDLARMSETSVWGPGLYASADADEARRWGSLAAAQRDEPAVYLHKLQIETTPDRYIGGAGAAPISDAAYGRLEAGLGRKIDRTGALPFVTLERRYGSVANGLRALGFDVFEHQLNQARPVHYLILNPAAAAVVGVETTPARVSPSKTRLL